MDKNVYKLRIAELNTLMYYKRERLLKQGNAYKYDFDKDDADIKIGLSDELIKRLNEESPHLSEDEVEYIFTGAAFYRELLKFNGIMLHSSAVVKDNEAYLFSAPSGTGKSTHTQLWLKKFDDAYILNDDKPAIREFDGKYYAYGTPWSGKTDWNVNKKVPLKAIIFIERAEKNFAEKMPVHEAVKMMYYQGYSAEGEDCKIKFLDFLDKLLRVVPVYRLGANMEIDAVDTIYNAVNGVK